MKHITKLISKSIVSFTAAAIVIGGAAGSVQATQWQSIVGAESPDRGSQALAFLPNELWIHSGDSIRWQFPTHERHTLTFLKPGQTRPPGFGPTFGIIVGCPGVTSDGSSFDGSSCVTSDVLLLPEVDTNPPAPAPTYTVNFPSPGNFKFVCLIHADMTGVVHVVDLSKPLPYDQTFYNHEAQRRSIPPAFRGVQPGASWNSQRPAEQQRGRRYRPNHHHYGNRLADRLADALLARARSSSR